ncbi:MAG: sulfatase [Pirellulales bacterium]|nr:sulfatase [Pirellulales bacterium]
MAMKARITLGLLVVLWGAWPAKAADAARPNIVVIVADDLGYGELGCYGGRQIPTPHLDALATGGVRMTDGYVSCPVCSPTRAGLLTGRYQQRFGHEFNPGPETEASPDFGLPLDQTTLADRLQRAGYKTGMVGKWHLGYQPKFHPLSRGFDEFYGFLAGAHAYLPGQRRQGDTPILRGREPVEAPEYLTDAFADEAVAFVDRHRSEPFFLYLPFNAVHGPLQATTPYEARFAELKRPNRRTFAAMLSAMDDAVGKLMGKLRAAGLEENTLVVFISDNGGPTPQTTSSNAPLSGFKGTVMEGGIRVPFMMQWKGHLPAGTTYSQPVIALDVVPTVLAATGQSTADPLDGVNLLPHLQGENSAAPHERLYWRFGQQSAIRQGNWKLLRSLGGKQQLFDLANDIAEEHDLSGERVETVKELQTAWEAWNAELVEPKWKRSDNRAQPTARRKARRQAAGRNDAGL